ncbi:hypothetical protein [Brucella anthropi]|uniref:hypothetical protein n=1 Tax=Brucella anthropi TaxID=529 RepID=UPI00124E29C1|nr:hypothetical protein [Brucella anthropi]KAB2752256.1 hypothetical protein F9L05_03850 [Brucella anthropi]
MKAAENANLTPEIGKSSEFPTIGERWAPAFKLTSKSPPYPFRYPQIADFINGGLKEGLLRTSNPLFEKAVKQVKNQF